MLDFHSNGSSPQMCIRDSQMAKQEMDTLLKRVNAIIMQSAEGEDPETTDYVESCGGDCGSCGGCH